MPQLPSQFSLWKDDSSNTNHISNLRGFLAILLFGYLVYRLIASLNNYRSDQALSKKNSCQPPLNWLPYKWPFALDILKLQYDALPKKQFLHFQSQYIDKYGPTMGVRVFGSVGFVTTEPRNVEAILATNFDDWGMGARSPALFPWLGSSIFTQEGRAWKHSREMLRRQFARIQHQSLDVFDSHIRDLITSISSHPSPINLEPLFMRYTLSTTTSLLFGESVKAISTTETDTFEESFDYAAYISAFRLRLADFSWIYKPKKFIEACEVNKKFADRFVEMALRDIGDLGEEVAREKYTFIVDLWGELRDRGLVRDQLVGVLVAGRDTTACLLSWCFYQLVRHPEVLKRLSEEIKSVRDGNGEITRVQIHKMGYLKCVINEVNRLYPQVPMNIRFALRTTTIPSGGGPSGDDPILIPKGTSVAYSVYHMHRRKDLYGEDAGSFRPERWEGDELSGIGWGFLPFHGGPRLCLGKDFALMEASYAIIRIIEAFPNLRLPDDEVVVPPGEEKQEFTLVVSSANGCRVVME